MAGSSFELFAPIADPWQAWQRCLRTALAQHLKDNSFVNRGG
jgi:hypothetical protein